MSRSAGAARLTAGALLSVVVGACSIYTPLDSLQPARGTAVRATLSSPVDVRLTDYTVNATVRVDGELISLDEERLALSVFEVRAANGAEFLARGETVVLPRAGLAALEIRRLSLPRSALFAGAVAGVVLTVDRMVGGLGGGNGGRDSPGGSGQR